MHLKPSEDGFSSLGVLPDLVGVVLRGDNNLVKGQSYLTAFSLSWGVVPICPDLEVVAQTIMFGINVFKENCLFSLVAVPPLVG